MAATFVAPSALPLSPPCAELSLEGAIRNSNVPPTKRSEPKFARFIPLPSTTFQANGEPTSRVRLGGGKPRYLCWFSQHDAPRHRPLATRESRLGPPPEI